MGTDKAFIEIEGEPMVVRAVGALQAAGAVPVLVVGGDDARLSALWAWITCRTAIPARVRWEG